MNSEKVGKVARITAGIYVFAIGLLILINQLISLIAPHKSGDQLTDLLQIMTTTISTLMVFVWSGVWIYVAYALFKNKRDNFPAILTWLILIGIGGVGINFLISKYQTPFNFGYNPFILLLFYFIPVVLIFISWKTEPRNRENSVERARRILGEHIKHLDDKELHNTLK